MRDRPLNNRMGDIKITTKIGKCMSMCPPSEVQMRERRGLLHFFEMAEPHLGKGSKSLKDRVVKEYSRSAAGKELSNLNLLRPPSVLQTTVHYLLNTVILDTRLAFPAVYAFVHDRLWAVRQDLYVQQPQPSECFCILEPMVRFYAYSAYRLGGETIPEYDPTLNHQHLLETLKWLLNLYVSSDHCSEERMEMEAVYILLNLGSSEALQRALRQKPHIRTGIVKQAEQLSLSWFLSNYWRVSCDLLSLPPLLVLITYTFHITSLRWFALKVMSVAYNSRNLTFPMAALKKMLLYNSVKELTNDCQILGLNVVDGPSVQFIKNQFKMEAKLVHFEPLEELNSRLSEIPLPELLLSTHLCSPPQRQ